MRITNGLATLLLTLAVTACSGIETRPAPIDTFVAGNYQYFKWRSEPLPTTTGSKDPTYLMDPIIRREVNKGLAARGYILDAERAQFSVDYIYASGLRIGERSSEISNVSPYPSVTPNRQPNQAVIDNAYALGGVKETSNIALQFNDVKHKKEVWQVIITKIVENVNKLDIDELQSSLAKGIDKALSPLPKAK
jgi:Domain of unknown function (DUF4136)